MTAPAGSTMRLWRVDLRTAQQLFKLIKVHQPGVRGTNRKHSPEFVIRYAREMLLGNWRFTHHALAFAGSISEGTAKLLDGEHRIRALILAATEGVTMDGVVIPPKPDLVLDFYVMEGVSEKAWLAMDIGRGRTAAHHLSSEGEVNTNVLSSAITLCAAYQALPARVPFTREHWVNSRMTPVARSRWLENNPEIREALFEGARLGKVMTVSAAAAGYFLARQSGADKGRLEQFMDGMRDGAGKDWGKGNPAWALRELLLNSRGTRRYPPREEQLALFIKAFNAFARGQKILLLTFRTKAQSNGSSAETFPTFAN